jgi:hypothetical protein
MSSQSSTSEKVSNGTSDLHSHFTDVLLELKQALARKGAAMPINDNDKAVDTLGDANAVATVVNDTFFPNAAGVDPQDIVNDTVRELARRIVLTQSGRL